MSIPILYQNEKYFIVDKNTLKLYNFMFSGYIFIDGIRYKKVTKKDFPLDLDDDGRVFLGSIIICEKKAIEQAEEFGHSIERELCYLFCHGLLHLFNYDHIEEKDDLEMRELANKVLSAIKVER